MSVQAAFCPLSTQTLFDANERAIRGAKIEVYDAGTTDPRPVYLDAGLTTAHTSPVRTNGFGRIPPIWVGEGPYKVVIRDPANALIESIDDLPGGVEVDDATAPSVNNATTGDVKFKHGAGLDDGWLPLNGKTIGNSDSNATARASDDVQALFVYLWNNDTSLVPNGGRGGTAIADYNAGKALPLPNYGGRTIVGVDKMGAASTAGVLTAATTATPDKTGTLIGTEKAALAVAQLPTFTPSVVISSGGGHTPTGVIGSDGGFTPTGAISAVSSHVHANYARYIAPTGGSVGVLAVESAGQGTSNSFDAGGHGHTFTGNAVPDHNHTLTMSAVPNHTHTATAASIGSGQDHANVQPGVLGYFHIKI